MALHLVFQLQTTISYSVETERNNALLSLVRSFAPIEWIQ